MSILAKSGVCLWGQVKTASREVNAFIVEEKARDLAVSLPSSRFTAVFYKAARRPHLTLHERSKTDDHELLADVFQAKACELGWIV